MKDLLVVVPSRGRPGNMHRLAEAMERTCRGDTHLVIGLDADDPTYAEYPQDIERETRGTLRQVVAWINELAVPRVDQYKYIGHFGDDNVPVTIGWDVQIMEALQKTPFAFANDHYPRAPGSLCCHVFTRSEVIGRLGYFGPPVIRHMYVDVAWMAWGVRTGITYLHEVDIPHHHYTLGAPVDESYTISSNLIPEDLEHWHAYCNSGDLNADIAKIDPEAIPFSGDDLMKFNMGLNIPRHWGVWW